MINIDVIGALYTSGTFDADGNTLTAPAALPGYHVNTTAPVVGWEAFKVTPATPQRVFGGHETHCYTFANQEEYEALTEVTNLAYTPLIVPQVISRAQAKLALLGVGLLSAVQSAIDAVPDPAMRAAMQIEWDDRLTFERTNPTLIALATGLGMSSTQLDQLFIVGATL